MSGATVEYDFAVLRVVPRVHLGAFINVGVVLHARTAEFLALRVLTDTAALKARLPGVDTELLARYLRSHQAIGAGDPSAGPRRSGSTGSRHRGPMCCRAHRCTRESARTLGPSWRSSTGRM
jgi:hypothetical protein